MAYSSWKSEVTLNDHGFYQLANPPTSEELKAYYAQAYYQQDRSLYEQQYSQAELAHLNRKIDQKFRIIEQSGIEASTGHLLDVGCGEGFTLKYFASRGWQVTGIDFSLHGCQTHNPDLVSRLIQTDLVEGLDNLTRDKLTFDVIWLDNILEHVLDPKRMITSCRQLLTSNGIIVIEVPNDFSSIQMAALQQGLIDREFWVVRPDHISYFNHDGLVNLCRDAGLQPFRVIADYPIDLALFNDATNYVSNPELGPAVHQARVAVEQLLYETSVDKANNLFEAMAAIGLGRQIIGYFTK